MQTAYFPDVPAAAWMRLWPQRLAAGTLLLLLAASLGCGRPSVPGPYSGPPRTLGEAVVRTARSQIGVPYAWGGASPGAGFDCSGYVCWVYAQHGYALPRRTVDQAKAGRAVSRKQLRAGDILVFRQPGRRGAAHTGLYAGNGRFLHSPKSGAHVTEEALFGTVWQGWLLGARRIAP